jgi:hypothetical protein
MSSLCRRSYWHIPRVINTVQDQGSSRNDNAALAYMLTNLVDATMAFQIVDIHHYMMESISVILQSFGPRGGVPIFSTWVRNFLPGSFVLLCFTL